MKRWRTAAAFAATIILSSVTQAAEYYYFNRPKVSRGQYVSDKVTCDRLAGGVSARPRESMAVYVPQNPNLSAGQNALAVGLATLFAGLILGKEDRKVVRAVERTCMADKGYGRYRVDKPLVKEIDKLPTEEERLDRYFELAATETPVGERVKE